MVTGSWDMSVRLWDPRTPCNAGTFTQPEKVPSVLRSACSLCACAKAPPSDPPTVPCVSGVHAVCGRGSSDRRYGGTQSARVGPEEHGIRPAETGIQPEVSDALHTSISKQTGPRCKRCRL